MPLALESDAGEGDALVGRAACGGRAVGDEITDAEGRGCGKEAAKRGEDVRFIGKTPGEAGIGKEGRALW